MKKIRHCLFLSVFLIPLISSTCNMVAYITIDSFYNGFPVSCAGAADAVITAYAQMGTPPYMHLWSTGDSLPYLYNVPVHWRRTMPLQYLM